MRFSSTLDEARAAENSGNDENIGVGNDNGDAVGNGVGNDNGDARSDDTGDDIGNGDYTNAAGNPYSDTKVLYHAEKLADIRDGRRTAPIYVRLKPTNVCNQRCYYCAYADGNHAGRSTPHAASIPWGKMQEILGDFALMGVKAVTLSGGGEPLCYPHIADVLRFLARNGIEYAINTNGQALEGEAAELLANANWIRVSIDAADAETYRRNRNVGTFDHVVENIRRFCAIKNTACEAGFNVVVAKGNAASVYDICALAADLGVNNVKFSPMLLAQDSADYHAPIRDAVQEGIRRAQADFSRGGLQIIDKYSGDENFNQESDKRYHRCYIAEYFTVVAADLKVYMCHQKAYMPEGEIGDLRDCGFRELWLSPETARRVAAFRPDRVCKNVCAFEGRNELLDSIYRIDKRFVNFV